MTTGGASSGERRYGGLSREERDAHRRARLMEAGLDVFGTVGYPESSVDAVCKAASVSSRSFYEYFAGREQLLIAIYDEIVAAAWHAVAGALSQVADDAPIRTRARAGLDAFAGHMLSDQRRAQVNFIEVVGASRLVEEHRRTALRSFAALVRQVAGLLVEQGTLAPWTPTQISVAATALIGAVQETLTDWMSGDEDDRLPLPDVLDGLVEVIALVAVAPPGRS